MKVTELREMLCEEYGLDMKILKKMKKAELIQLLQDKKEEYINSYMDLPDETNVILNIWEEEEDIELEEEKYPESELDTLLKSVMDSYREPGLEEKIKYVKRRITDTRGKEQRDYAKQLQRYLNRS